MAHYVSVVASSTNHRRGHSVHPVRPPKCARIETVAAVMVGKRQAHTEIILDHMESTPTSKLESAVIGAFDARHQ
jgi:hypothetical protein